MDEDHGGDGHGDQLLGLEKKKEKNKYGSIRVVLCICRPVHTWIYCMLPVDG
jgi:hypothetical protein